MINNNIAFIVEDDDQLGDIFSKSLEGLYLTELVKDGIAAVERLTEIAPDLIILDLHLPGMDGDKILAGIRSNPNLDSSRVILCTADARKAELMHDKADIVLLKPVNPVQLRQIASRFLVTG